MKIKLYQKSIVTEETKIICDWCSPGEGSRNKKQENLENFQIIICLFPPSRYAYFDKDFSTFLLLAKYLPYFTFLTLFRVASFALVLVVFGYYAILVYAIMLSIIIIVGGLVVVKRSKGRYKSLVEYWKWEAENSCWYYPILLAFRSLFTEGTGYIETKYESFFVVNDNQQPRTLFQGFWFLTDLLFIASLNYLVNIGEGHIYNFFNLDKVHIIKNKIYFNVAIGTIFFSGGLSFVLFVVQIRKKYVDRGQQNSEVD